MTNSTASTLQIQFWPIDKFVFYTRNPRKNDAAVDRMVASLQEFGFAIPVLARSSGEVIDGHLRLKGALKTGSWPAYPSNSLRRLDRYASQSLPALGEPIGVVGRLG
jgi:hypothetical protein